MKTRNQAMVSRVTNNSPEPDNKARKMRNKKKGEGENRRVRDTTRSSKFHPVTQIRRRHKGVRYLWNLWQDANWHTVEARRRSSA